MNQLQSLCILALLTSLAYASNSTQEDLEDIAARRSLIPWNWVVQSSSESAPKCPSSFHTLGMFAAVNLVGCLISLVVSNRHVTYAITCTLCGRPNSQAWYIPVLFQIGLHLSSSFLNAALIAKSSGYSGVPVSELALLFLCRPRFTWIPLTALMSTEPYRNTALATVVMEMILQLFGAYTMGKAAHFAASRGYYLFGHHKFPHGNDAYLMYCGAMVFLALLFYTWVAGVFAVTLYYEKRRGPDGRDVGENIPLVMSFILYSWIGSWLFWAGFIKLSGDLFCLPNLIQTGSIFATFSILSSFLGTGLA